MGLQASADGTSAVAQVSNTSTGAGVHATSTHGRGGVFAGGPAQVRLTPGSTSTHPASGERGDLYVDSTGRLWFCKTGGTKATSHQLA